MGLTWMKTNRTLALASPVSVVTYVGGGPCTIFETSENFFRRNAKIFTKFDIFQNKTVDRPPFKMRPCQKFAEILVFYEFFGRNI
jgi:hypothetical protein